MTEPSSRKEGFKKCRSATFSIDGYSFTIGEPDLIPPLSFISLFVPSLQLQLKTAVAHICLLSLYAFAVYALQLLHLFSFLPSVFTSVQETCQQYAAL